MHDLDGVDRERQRLFARSVRAARKRAHLTQVDVADALGVSEKAYAGYENARGWPVVPGPPAATEGLGGDV